MLLSLAGDSPDCMCPSTCNGRVQQRKDSKRKNQVTNSDFSPKSPELGKSAARKAQANKMPILETQ